MRGLSAGASVSKVFRAGGRPEQGLHAERLESTRLPRWRGDASWSSEAWPAFPAHQQRLMCPRCSAEVWPPRSLALSSRPSECEGGGGGQELCPQLAGAEARGVRGGTGRLSPNAVSGRLGTGLAALWDLLHVAFGVPFCHLCLMSGIGAF